MVKSKVYFFVATNNTLNSIRIQIDLISKILEELFNVDTFIIHTGIKNYRTILKDVIRDEEVLFWHYGGFDSNLNIFRTNKNVIFVYHNITPAKYFWSSEPKVSIRSIMGIIQLFLINKKHNWITMSEFNRKELYGFGFKKVMLCPNLISTYNANTIEKSKDITLIFVGRISPNKNCISLLEHVERVANQLESTINLIIVGSTKSGCKFGRRFSEKYKELTTHSNLRINWINEINAYGLNELYKRSWLYVSMSLHEGFGVPACESIANGTPALYLECGGQESVLKSTGMVSKQEEDIFYTKIIEVVLNEDKRQQLYNQQIEIVSRLISPDVDKQIFESYKNVIN